MIKVTDNFLNVEYFKEIKNILLSDTFPWYYNNSITDKNDPKNYYYFTHVFYVGNSQNSNYFSMWSDFLKQIDCKGIIRIKASMYLNIDKKRKHENHVDYNFSHKGCLFYINDNNGETYFENKKIKPKENRAVFFDPHKPHASSLCTNQKRRVVINFNYF